MNKRPVFVPMVWLVCYTCILAVDSIILISVVLSKDWPWILNWDNGNGRMWFAVVLAVATYAMIKCIPMTGYPRHLIVAVALFYFTAVFFALWGVFELLGTIKHVPFLATVWGKWTFTLLCSFLFLPWLSGFNSEISALGNAMQSYSQRREFGGVYSFLYAWSGAAYLLMKIYILVGIGLYLLFLLEWSAFLNGHGLVLRHFMDNSTAGL